MKSQNVNVIFELKQSTSGTSADAIKQIKERKYYEIVPDDQKCILVGLSISENLKISCESEFYLDKGKIV